MDLTGLKNVFGERFFYFTRDGLKKFLANFKGEGDPYNLIKANKAIKDTHKGERCFILGNGPSLKTIDFKKLADEFVFSVNYFNLIEGYQDAKTNVHLWMDLNTFDMRPEVKEDPVLLKRNFEDIIKENPVCFIPADAYPFVKKTGLDNDLDIKYVIPGRTMVDKKILDVDLTKTLYASSTVVQYAIQIAIYMGFSEIYLLGCDSTNILTHLNTILGQSNTSLHAYSSKIDNAESATRELMQTWKTNRFIYDHYVIFRGYDLLNDYCNKVGVKLYNCSNPTLITEIQRADFDDIISRK